MRFFNIFMPVVVVLLLAGCGVEAPTEPEAEILSFERLELPSYKYVNGEILLYRMVLKAKEKNVPIEAFAWNFILQQLNLSNFKLSAYKDANFTTTFFEANPIAMNERAIPDGRPDFYYGSYPGYLIYLSTYLGEKNYIILPANTPVYFELKGKMEVTGSYPGLAIYLEGAYLAQTTTAKKPTVLFKDSARF